MQRFDPIVIYQMGKVGSKTIQASLEKLNLPNKIYHTHFLSWSNIKQIEDHYSSIPGTNVRLDHCKDIRSLIDSTAGNIRWKIITLVRDPVTRDISDVFENIKRDLPHVTNVDPESAFNDISSHILKTFADFNESTDYACTWFDKEIKDVFNFDIYANDFNKSTGYQIYRVQDADILLIRLEDLSRCCHDAFREFLGVPDFSMVKDNVGEKKWYQGLYRRVLDSISIPDSDLERIYKSRYCRHFYTGDEINHFKKKWSGEKTEIKSVTVASSQRNSSNSGKILIVHPEGNINNNPNLTGIVEILCENGYKVDICSLRRSNIYQYSWCAGASLFLLDRPENLVENGTFILEDPKLNSQEEIISYINENFKSYDLVIGVDRGIIEAALIAQNRQIPCGLISYEIFFEEETSREFKQEEIEACKCLDFIVCQDALRAKYLSIENKIALEKIINIPVAGRGIKKGEKNSYLYDSLGIDKDKKIALFMGSVAQWSMADYILESAKLWSEDWVLVVHSRYGLDQHVRPYYEKYKHLDNIYFSLEPVADPNKMHRIIHSADIGFAFYKPLENNIWAGNNIRYLGMASGKIATYLQHGLPIIINEIGQLSDYVRKYGLGLVVDDNGNFSTPLTDGQLLKFRLNCLEFFEKRLDLNHTIVPLLKIIQRLFDKQAVTVSSENSLALGTKDFLAGKVEHPVINSAEKYNLSGEELLGRKDIDGALNAFKKAIEVAPHFIAAHNNIGKAYLQKGELANALKYFTKALKINPYDIATVLNCGQVLTSHGLAQKARSLYRSYLRENPNDNKVIQALESLNCEKRIEGRDDVTPEYKKDLIARAEHIAMEQNQGDVESRKYLVSAIVSMYNSQRFIRGCLEDLENQTIADKLEIIVVNSGSQQNEEAIVNAYQQKHNNIVYIKTEQREGIYTAWNRAIKVARGTFLTNANTDDRHREDALEIMAETLLANPDVALVYGDQICTDTPNGTFANHHAIEMAKRAEYSHERLLFGCCVGSQPMWRKSLHTELGYFDDTLTCAGDWDFWLRLSSKYKFKHIPEFLGLYYYNENGIEHGRKIHSLYERYIVGKRYGNPYISVIPLYTSKNNPLVSVIMPAYNAAEHIAEAIESVLIQNYKNFELLIINDGSTDNTEEVVLGFKDERIRYFRQENRGLAATHNVGIKKSRGEFIIKLDSDDMMMPDFIARHLQEFENHSDTDLVYCDDCLINEDSKPIRVIERPEYTDRKMLIRDLFRCGFPVVPFRTCIRRSVFDKIGFFDENLRMAEDYDMMRRFVKMGLKIQHLPGALYLRRMTPDSLSRNFTSQNAKFHFDVVGRFTDTFTCDELFPDVAWDQIAPQMRQLHAKCLTAGTYLAIGQEYVKTNATEYSRTAFDRACSELNDCVKIEPENQGLRKLLQKSKLIRARYTEAPQQVVSK
jgi:glycosyltransferase involved in cell wall biosynthesis